MKVVFIGDSLTSGENNNCESFAHYYKQLNSSQIVEILGVSGACFGNYSIYPVEESLFSLIKDNLYKFRDTDLVVIEFGINDTASLLLKYVDLNKVHISFMRAVDQLKQVNSQIKILFLFPFDSTVDQINFNQLISYGCNYLDYLYEDYFKMCWPPNLGKVTSLDFVNCYLSIIDLIKSSQFDYLFMNSLLGNNFINYLDEDNIHLNRDGYLDLAKTLSIHVKQWYRELCGQN